MSKRLFISKNASEIIELLDFAPTRDLIVTAHSFLRFESVSCEPFPTTDAIFFGSPRAVLFFKAQQEIPKSIEIACVGAKTAQLLESMGFQIAFNGSEEKDIHAVAASFKSWLGDRSVLFPTSDRSLHTISKGLPARQIREVIVYKTVVSGKAIPQQEIYVFTSPSNVEGFLSENTVPMDAHIVAWGKSTAHALESYGISSFILEEPSLTALIAHIKLV